jgi:hypothetical protein
MNNSVNYIQHKIWEKNLKTDRLKTEEDLNELIKTYTNRLLETNSPEVLTYLIKILFEKATLLNIKIEESLMEYI